MQTLEVGGVRGVGAGRLVTTTTSLKPGQVVLSRLDGWAEGVNVRSEGGNPHLMVNVKI